MKTLPSLVLALGFAMIARAQEPQSFDVKPGSAGGTVISVRTKADEERTLDELVKLGTFPQAEADAKKAKLPAIRVNATVTRKSAAAARPANFSLVITDAKGKEVAKHTGKAEMQEKNPNFAGGGVSVFFEIDLASEPEWPIKVEVKDSLAGKSGVFAIEPRKVASSK